MEWLKKLFGEGASPRSRLIRGLLLGLIVFACVYRVWLVFHYNPMDAIWSDPQRHWVQGTHPLDTQPHVAIDPILYQVYVGTIAKLTAGSPVLVAYWTALLSLCGPWLWYRFLRELLPSRDWALGGWAMFAALPSWSGIYSYLMQETLMLPLLGAALWVTWRCRRKADTASFILAVAVWMLAGLTRGICIPLAAVSMTWLWLTQGDKVRRVAWSIVLLAAVLGPLAGRSWYLIRQISPHGFGTMVHLYAKAGTIDFSIEFSREGGKKHWRYAFMSPGLTAPPFAPLSDWQSIRSGHAHFTIDLDAGSRDWDAMKASLPPWTFERAARLTADNLALLFFSHSWPESDRTRVNGMLSYWMRWIWAPLALICLVWTIACWSKQRERLLPALLLVWFLVQGVFPLAVNEGRYRKPFEGLLLAQCLLLASSSRSSVARRPAPGGPTHAHPPG